MEADNLISSPARRSTSAAGVAGFFCFFAGLCAIFSSIVTVMDWRDETAQARWPVISAKIERGEVSTYQRKENGGLAWQLRYSLSYELGGQEHKATLHSSSATSIELKNRFDAWARQHRKGSRIDIRYDPAQPSHVVFAATDVPNAGPRAASDLYLASMFAVACLGLWVLAKFLRARAPGNMPGGANNLSPGGRIFLGLIVAAMGCFIVGNGVYAAIHAWHPLTSEDFLALPAGLIFVFGGVVLALPPDKTKLQKLFGTLLVTAFAMTLDWIAFGPGTRQFSGGLSISFINMGFNPGEMFGRTLFGLCALGLDIMAIAMWVSLVRQSSRRP